MAQVDPWVRELNESGIAVFIFDSFTGRGFGEGLVPRDPVGSLTMLVDTYRALELLGNHPRIDPTRIALMGFARGGGAAAPTRRPTDSQPPIPWRTARLARLDDDRDTTRRASPVWREREELLRRVPGSGPVCPCTLLLDLPAWGPLSRQRLAALVGVAPLNRESGTRRGSRTSWGGRAHVWATRSMSPRVAVRDTTGLNVFYERLRAAGKTAKVALAACRRKLVTILNAMVTHHTPWPPQEVLGA